MLDVLEEVKRSPGQGGQPAEKPRMRPHQSLSRFTKPEHCLLRPPYSGAGSDTGDVPVIRGEYEQLLKALKTTGFRGIVLTATQGLVRTDTTFSLNSNTNPYPILRQGHLPLLPPFTSS